MVDSLAPIDADTDTYSPVSSAGREIDESYPRVAIGIATSGRSAILRETLAELGRQTLRPARTIVCYESPEDIAGLTVGSEVEFTAGPSGLVDKRNIILDEARDCDVILFIDDDFLPASDYVRVTAAAFAEFDDIVVTTGAVVADGITGPGLTVEQGRGFLGRPAPEMPVAIEPALNGYGCNMAIRLSLVHQHALRFDEMLPLYGWFEDVDFTRRAGVHGRIVKLSGARGVHLGAKIGRGSGLRLGYSQVVNPLYLARKGSCPRRKAWHFVLLNCAMNMFRSVKPEAYIDRRGRMRGNLLAVGDLLRGVVDPVRVLRLEVSHGQPVLRHQEVK